MIQLTTGFHADWDITNIANPSDDGKQLAVPRKFTPSKLFLLQGPSSGTYSVTATFAPSFDGEHVNENDTFTLAIDQDAPIANASFDPCVIKFVAVKVVLNSGSVTANGIITGVEA